MGCHFQFQEQISEVEHLYIVAQDDDPGYSQEYI